MLSAAVLAGTALAEFQVHNATFKPEYVLEATLSDIKINCNTRRSVVLNGTSPGPTLHLREGHTTWVRVYNRMSDQNITIHWHGLSQRTAPFSDGTPLVSQWPIAPRQFFDYQIRPEHGDAGTYFYHSHVGFQQSTAHGALIVLDAKAPAHHYEKDLTLVLGDFYQQDDRGIESGLQADPFKWSGEPQAITVQGSSGRSGFAKNASTKSCAPHIVDVEPGKTYRLRVIGATVLSLVKVGIEDHSQSLRVIEADGADTEPVRIDHIQVASGQRFSFLLETKSQDEIEAANRTHYWIRYESRDRPQSITGYALLRYRVRGSKKCRKLPAVLPDDSPVTLPESTTDYLEYALHPHLDAVKKEFPRLSEVTRTVVIQVNQNLATGNYVDGKLNGTVVWE
ncbi:Multicopper oxidase aurL2 [Conoideocrella luteorostrata]|uniref:Multicopper oxidase aurL2 n=1 Tax=Conoideocrella luteorostrata TaxID=1105319 RepID=A0AAJ0FZ65_9HYPO|nr:Multicopper oxidase aurL2 [Conoideocrella luteorostrata]